MTDPSSMSASPVSVGTVPHGAGLSRRRVIQGAAWAAPAVLVATAAPAAAASPPVLGGVVITGASASMNSVNFFVTATLAYAGDGAPSPDYPVSAVRMTVTLPTSRVTAATPGVSNVFWSYVSRAVVGSNTVFTFAWNGADLSATQPATTQVTVRIPSTTSVAAVNIPINASGVSNGITVPATQVIVPATLGAIVVVDNPAIDFVTYMPNPSGGQQNGYRMQGQGRWAGPNSPTIGPNVSDLRLVMRIPAANTDGTYHVSVLGAGWSLAEPPTLTGGFWQASWAFANTIGKGNENTTNWDIFFKALGAKQLNVVQCALYGTGGGSPNYTAWAGPVS